MNCTEILRAMHALISMHAFCNLARHEYLGTHLLRFPFARAENPACYNSQTHEITDNVTML